MSNHSLKADNLAKLLEGLFLLDEHDQERIISSVNALNFAKKKAKNFSMDLDAKAKETAFLHTMSCGGLLYKDNS